MADTTQNQTQTQVPVPSTPALDTTTVPPQTQSQSTQKNQDVPMASLLEMVDKKDVNAINNIRSEDYMKWVLKLAKEKEDLTHENKKLNGEVGESRILREKEQSLLKQDQDILVSTMINSYIDFQKNKGEKPEIVQNKTENIKNWFETKLGKEPNRNDTEMLSVMVGHSEGWRLKAEQAEQKLKQMEANQRYNGLSSYAKDYRSSQNLNTIESRFESNTSNKRPIAELSQQQIPQQQQRNNMPPSSTNSYKNMSEETIETKRIKTIENNTPLFNLFMEELTNGGPVNMTNGAQFKRA